MMAEITLEQEKRIRENVTDPNNAHDPARRASLAVGSVQDRGKSEGSPQQK